MPSILIWAIRRGDRAIGVGAGLVIGGAIGNAWDRAVEGAVAIRISETCVMPDASGELMGGVFVDVSAQAAMAWTLLNAGEAFAIQGRDYERAGSQLQVNRFGVELGHPCKDGFLIALAIGGMFLCLEPWMIEEGIVDTSFREREDWATYDGRVFGGAELAIPFEELTETFDRFFRTT